MPRPDRVVALGVTRGRIPTTVVAPPPPLPPTPEPPRGKVGSTGVPIEEVVREMVVSYKDFVRGERCGPLLRKMDGDWRHVLRLMASDLMDEGLSGAAYVRHVCEGIRKLKRRDPWPSEVFSRKSFEGWLPSYRTSGGAELQVDGYIVSEERRAAHLARNHA